MLLIKLEDFLWDLALELLEDACPLLTPAPTNLKKQSFK
jgi:hypothetical protein